MAADWQTVSKTAYIPEEGKTGRIEASRHRWSDSVCVCAADRCVCFGLIELKVLGEFMSYIVCLCAVFVLLIRLWLDTRQRPPSCQH